MTDICRLCLLEISSPNSSIYEEDVPNETKIKYVIPEIDLNITTALTFCNLCSSSLGAAYKFKQGCLKTETNLQEYIKNCNLSLPIDLEDYKNYVSRDSTPLEDEIMQDEDTVCMENVEEQFDVFEEQFDVFEEQFDVFIRCNKCGILFHDDESYKAHEEQCTLYKCSKCNNDFLSMEEMQKHSQEHASTKESDLKGHLQGEHSPSVPFKADISEKRRSSSKKLYSCPFCPKSWASRYPFNLHVESHNSKDLPCKKCGKTLPGSFTLRKHMRDEHINPLVCEFCGIKRSTRQALDVHRRIHTGERPFCCEICGKAFTQKHILMSHRMSIHNTETPYVCEHCGKAFRVKMCLSKHMKVHKYKSKGKTILCQFENCGKKFYTRVHLNQHMVYHRERKAFCELCGKGFHTKYEVKKHMSTHTGKKPYECDICHKDFSRLYALHVHIKSHRPKEKEEREHSMDRITKEKC